MENSEQKIENGAAPVAAERETAEITLPRTGKMVIYRTYMTAREMLAATKIEDAIETTKYFVRTLVVSIDGGKENLADTVLDLPLEDYRKLDAIMLEIAGAGTEKKN